MATVHVWDGGSNTSPYDTWAKAATSWWTASAYGGSSDDLHMADDHYEDPGSNKLFTGGGNYTKSRRCITVNRTTGLPSFPASPQIDNTAGSLWVYDSWTFENCWFRCTGSFKLSASSADAVYFRNCRLDTYNVNGFESATANCQMRFEGGSMHSLLDTGNMNLFQNFIQTGSSFEAWGTEFYSDPGATILWLHNMGTATGAGYWHGCDFSGVSNVNWLGDHQSENYGRSIVWEDCEIPSMNNSTLFNPARVSYCERDKSTMLSNCSEGENLLNNLYGHHVFGIWQTDRDIYRDDGAADPDNNHYSLRIDSNSITQKAGRNFRGRLITLPLAADASEVSVEIARDGSSTPFTDKEVWIEVGRPKSSDNSLIIDRSRPASLRDSASNWPASSKDWTGLSGTNVKQTITCPLTGTSKAGLAHVWICFAVASDAVNVCMKPGVA